MSKAEIKKLMQYDSMITRTNGMHEDGDGNSCSIPTWMILNITQA
jgi:hypothetical protein